MHANSSLLAVIPARGGSKGLPGKNVLSCAGKPLIEWTIDAAKNATSIDDVLVSTDSPEIADVARKAGAAVPFLRPSELSTDQASLLQVLQHAWEQRRSKSGAHYDYIVLLQPTSPLRTADHIESAIQRYFTERKSKTDTLASVYEVSTKFGWLMQDDERSNYVRFCLNVATQNPQRQRLKNYYLPNGAIFIACGKNIMEGLYRDNTIPFVMQSNESVDIDTADDLYAAEQLLLNKAGLGKL